MLGPKLFEPQRMSGDEGLQCGAAVIGDLDRRQPQLAAGGEQQRAAIAHNVDVGGADGGELAALLCCRIAHKERAHSGRRSDQKIAARSAFHGWRPVAGSRYNAREHSRHCDHRGGINVIAAQGTKSSRISAIGRGREPIDREWRPRPNHLARPHGEDCRALSARRLDRRAGAHPGRTAKPDIRPAEHVPAKTVAEFIAWAKQKGHVSFGSPGVGTSPHLSGVLFAKRSGLDAVHVPFRGAAQTIPAMLSGAVDFAIDNLASYISLIQSGQMRALAVTSAQRWPTLPNVPTMAEAGVKDFVVTSWAAFVLPAATPRPIVDKLAGAMKQIAADVAMQKRFLVAGARILSSTPEEAIAFAAKERAMWKDVVALSGLKPQ